MKKLTVVIPVLIMVLLMISCSSMKSATVETNGNNITFKERNLSLLSPSVTPSEMAELIDAQARAEYMKSIVSKARGGKKFGNYIIAIINNDPSQEAYFFDPEIPGYRIPLKPNGGVHFLPVQTIPTEIALYKRRGGNVQMFHKLYPLNDTRRYDNGNSGYKKSVLGVEVDLRYIINRIY